MFRFKEVRESLRFSLYFHLKCSSFRARTRPNLHSTLQFSSPTPCDSSPLHDSPRANSLTIRSSHLASEDPPPRSRSHSNKLPAPDHRSSVFLEGERGQKVLCTHCFSPAPHLTPMKRRKDTICILLGFNFPSPPPPRLNI